MTTALLRSFAQGHAGAAVPLRRGQLPAAAAA